MDSLVMQLESKIETGIVIPHGLENNIRFRTTGLGGVFINYCSDARGGVASLNSNVQFTIMFDTTNGAGRFVGENIGVEMTQNRNIKCMRSIKTKQHYTKVITKVNKWLNDNREYLINSIQ